MNEDASVGTAPSGSRPLPPATVLAAAIIVILALAALLVPRSRQRGTEAVFLVVDPLSQVRGESCYGPLTQWLNEVGQQPLRLQCVSALTDANRPLWDEIDLVLCPDGVALALPADQYVALALGRRQAPNNLRPRSVLVYRREAGSQSEPWITAPQRTILGDSLSLAGCGVVCRKGTLVTSGGETASWRQQLTFGPDPYDHAPALHALRLDCFDYAVVRELAVDRFEAAGLLDPEVWGVEELTAPLPDIVVMVARDCPAATRMRLGEALVGLGRHPGDALPLEQAVRQGLAGLGLDGFNLLLEPDFSQIRRRFDRCWPRGGN